MNVAVNVVGSVSFGLGLLGAMTPSVLLALAERTWKSHAGLDLTVTFRAVLGVILLGADYGNL